MLSLLASPGRRPALVTPGRPPVARIVASLTGLAAAVGLATLVDVGPRLHAIALFLHLAALVLGFGAVLAIDWVGLCWVLRRRRLADVLAAVAALTTPIWIGLAGLVVTGVFLGPDPTSPRTATKIAAVAVLMCNGHLAGRLHGKFVAAADRPSRGLLARSFASTAVSQLCWWTATVVGFLNARS